jgi:large subunit ribosomal protein L2
MSTKKYKPTSPGRRQRIVSDYSILTKCTPENSLLQSKKNTAGRNNAGKLTLRSRGGGNKRKYRIIDFKRNHNDVSCIVKSVEYDPFRTSFISLVHYKNGKKSYIITPSKIKIGDELFSGPKAEIKTGHVLKLSDIPIGTSIHNIELKPLKGAQLVRSAGSFALITGKNNNYVIVKLPSGEVRMINGSCSATIGKVSNDEHHNTSLGLAGATRWIRRRSKVRGSVMNPCDHPHGGGEGRAPIGHSGPRSKWGKPTLGFKTKKNKDTSYLIKKRK